MSLNFHFEYFDLEEDVHEPSCNYEYGSDCVCKVIYKKFQIEYTTTIVSNQQHYSFENSSTFYISPKLDLKNLKKFCECLENPEKIEEIVEKAKQKNFGEMTGTHFDGTALTKNQRLIYSSEPKILHFELRSSRDHGNFIEYNLVLDEIVFGYKDYQCCTDHCTCHDCEKYSRFEKTVCMKIPFKLETRKEIIQLFQEICIYLEH